MTPVNCPEVVIISDNHCKGKIWKPKFKRRSIVMIGGDEEIEKREDGAEKSTTLSDADRAQS